VYTSKFITTIRVDQPGERTLRDYVLTQDLLTGGGPVSHRSSASTLATS
jgi:hypothetical protein